MGDEDGKPTLGTKLDRSWCATMKRVMKKTVAFNELDRMLVQIYTLQFRAPYTAYF